MLYQAYQFQDDLIAPLRDLARRLQSFSAAALWGPAGDMARHFSAALEMISRFEIAHERPDFAIRSVMIGNRDARIRLTQEILRAFEPAIRQHLNQWFHFVPVWTEAEKNQAPTPKHQ